MVEKLENLVETTEKFIDSTIAYTIDLITTSFVGVDFFDPQYAPIGIGIPLLVLVLSFMHLVSEIGGDEAAGNEKKNKKPAPRKPVHKDLEALARIEKKMLELKRQYGEGKISADAYLSESRGLVTKAHKFA